MEPVRAAHGPHRPAADRARRASRPRRSRASSRASRSSWCSAARSAAPVRPAGWPGFGDAAELCDDLHEWDYGDYEGLTTAQIRQQTARLGLWRDGCPGGESPDEVGARLDRVLDAVRRRRRRRPGVRARPFAAGADRPLARDGGRGRRALQARRGGDRRARPRALDADDRPLERLSCRRGRRGARAGDSCHGGFRPRATYARRGSNVVSPTMRFASRRTRNSRPRT